MRRVNIQAYVYDLIPINTFEEIIFNLLCYVCHCNDGIDLTFSNPNAQTIKYQDFFFCLCISLGVVWKKIKHKSKKICKYLY